VNGRRLNRGTPTERSTLRPASMKRRLPDSGLRRNLTPDRLSASEFQRAARGIRATVDCIGGKTLTCSSSSNRFVLAATGTSATCWADTGRGVLIDRALDLHRLQDRDEIAKPTAPIDLVKTALGCEPYIARGLVRLAREHDHGAEVRFIVRPRAVARRAGRYRNALHFRTRLGSRIEAGGHDVLTLELDARDAAVSAFRVHILKFTT
jgi:hypothetical protein